MKTPVLGSLFNKVTLKFFIKKRLQHRNFLEYWKLFQNSFCYRAPATAFNLTLLYTFND